MGGRFAGKVLVVVGLCVAVWGAAGVAQESRGAKPVPEKNREADYVSNLNVPSRPPGKTPRAYSRKTPPLSELLELKAREDRLSRAISREDLTSLGRIRAQIQLVQCTEAMGEDPLPRFGELCRTVAGSKELGSGKAWELASENIGRLYDGRYYDECYRYCKMVSRSQWAGNEARAWALLRMICCDRLRGRFGAMRCGSHQLMSRYPETEAARNHTKAAVQYLTFNLQDDRALQLLEKMAGLHDKEPEFVADCIEGAIDICQRLGRTDELRGYADRLERMSADEDGVPPKVRARCVRQSKRLRRWIALQASSAGKRKSNVADK